MKHFITCALLGTLTLGACQTEQSPKETTAHQDIGAYIIVRGKDYDREALAAYNAALPPIYAKYGGTYIALAPKGAYKMLEGEDLSDAIVMSKWPSVEAAQEFWDSPEYREAIKLREGNGQFTVVIVPALPSNK